MSQFDPSSRGRRGLSAIAERVFPEREIMVRSHDRVRFFRLSPQAQLAGVAFVISLTAWGTVASSAYLGREASLAAAQGQVARAVAAYESLLEHMTAHHEEMAAIADGLDGLDGTGGDDSADTVDSADVVKGGGAVSEDRAGAQVAGLPAMPPTTLPAAAAVPPATEGTGVLYLAGADPRSPAPAGEAKTARSGPLVRHLRTPRKTARRETARDRAPSSPGHAGAAATATRSTGTTPADATPRNESLRAQDELAARLRDQLELLSRDLDYFATRGDIARPAANPAKADPQKLALETEVATRQRDTMKRQVTRLRTEVSDLKDAQAEMLQQFSSLAGNRVRDMEQALTAAGLDLQKLLGKGPESAPAPGPQLAALGPPTTAATTATSMPPAANRAVAGGGAGARFNASPLQNAVLTNDSGRLRTTLASLNVSVGRMDNLHQLARSVPLGMPVAAARLTSTFGSRDDPINGNPSRHEGLDLAAPSRTPIHATASGVVIFEGMKGRYGRAVIIDHGRGFQTLYGHMHKTTVVKGQKVERGDQIGQVGSTGRSTGPHLHYEVRVNGKPQDPYRFIKAGRDVLKG